MVNCYDIPGSNPEWPAKIKPATTAGFALKVSQMTIAKGLKSIDLKLAF
jgi:hypothetical protein